MGSLFASTLNTRALPTGSLRFIRSDCPAQLTDEEAAWLRENGVTTVVDLRSPEECAGTPSRLETEEGFIYYHLPVTGGGNTPKNGEELRKIYIGMLDERMDEIIDTLLNAPDKALYFCGSGKDRTGVVSAVLLKKLGFDRQTIIDDYMETKENLADFINAFIAGHPEVDPELLIPNEENIKKVLDALDKKEQKRKTEETGMLTVYSSPLCPDCRECKANFDAHGIEYRLVDINENMPNLKAFLKLRDSSPVFDPCREGGFVGIPAIVREDGSVTLDWESILSERGLPIVYREEREKQFCSIDGKGC